VGVHEDFAGGYAIVQEGGAGQHTTEEPGHGKRASPGRIAKLVWLAVLGAAMLVAAAAILGRKIHSWSPSRV
jgi:hypothetical protein